MAGTGGGAAKVGGAEGKRALAYQLPGCARLPGGARMIYSVIEHPCRCGRNSMATPTVWNVRAAPAASATTTAATGMFMLLPLCLYLVAVLPLHCSSSAVPATDAAVVLPLPPPPPSPPPLPLSVAVGIAVPLLSPTYPDPSTLPSLSPNISVN